jgi:trk system potassium uptake protein TrkH
MIDPRPVAGILGWILLALAGFMLVPMGLELWTGQPGWIVFLESALMTGFAGMVLAMASSVALSRGLSLRQSYLLTVATWIVLPAFGAVPFVLGEPHAGWTDAIFESMSGLTTTGTTVFEGLDLLPPGILLWRSILQWLGGLGIIVVALVFLPAMKVGGMQHFRSEGFDTQGKILPRVQDIAKALLGVYAGLTLIAAVVYASLGMSGFDAVNHALTTIATGGFSTSDLSFGKFTPAAEYAGAVMMWASGLPFIRYVQLVNGSARPMWRDVQVRAYARWTLYAVGAIIGYRLLMTPVGLEEAIRSSAFNTISIMTGTGYGSADVTAWGEFALLILIMVGFVGACTGSTGCSIKVFRFQVLFEAIRAQVARLGHPSRVTVMHLGGRRIEDDVIASVIVMFTAFVAGFGVLAILLTLTGLEMRTAITSAWTAICNIGPAFGREVGETGAVGGFPVGAKWLMIAGMLFGRLEMIVVLVILLPRFWRD